MRLDEDPWRSLHDAEVSCHKQMYHGQQHADENTSKVSLQLQTTHGYIYKRISKKQSTNPMGSNLAQASLILNSI